MNPKVSVGIPVFNGENSLLRCLEGLLNQVYQPFEVMIIDNCSTDRTREICLDFVKLHPNFHYSRNDTNIGGAANLNKTLKSVSGDFFMWAAHDDFHDPNYIQSCMKLMLLNPSAVLCNTGINVCVDSIYDITFRITMKTFKNIRNRTKRFKQVYLRYPSPSFYGLYRTNKARQISDIKPTFGAEFPWALELSLCGEFVSSDTFEFYYINSLTQMNSYDNLLDSKYTLKAKIQYYFSRQFSYLKIVSKSELDKFEKIALYIFILWRILLEGFVRVILTILVRFSRYTRKVAIFFVRKFLINPNYLIHDCKLFEDRELPRILDRWTF